MGIFFADFSVFVCECGDSDGCKCFGAYLCIDAISEYDIEMQAIIKFNNWFYTIGFEFCKKR